MANQPNSGSTSTQQNERAIHEEDGIPEITEDIRNVADESGEDEFEEDLDDEEDGGEESI